VPSSSCKANAEDVRSLTGEDSRVDAQRVRSWPLGVPMYVSFSFYFVSGWFCRSVILSRPWWRQGGAGRCHPIFVVRIIFFRTRMLRLIVGGFQQLFHVF